MSKSNYKWIIVGISFVNIAASYGLNFCFSIFFPAILEEFRWSRASIVGAFSLSALLLGISSWFGGRLTDRFGSRKIMIGGAIILSLSTLASGWIRELWHLYALFGVFAAIGIAGLGRVPHSVLLSNWFVQKRGTMVGIAFSGMGIGILITGPLSQFLISQYGWRTAYGVLGLMALGLLLPLNCFVRNRPEKEDGNPIHDYRDSNVRVNNKFENINSWNDRGADWTLGHAMRTLTFWSLFFATLLTPLGIYPVMVHQVVYVVDQGYSKMLAASIFGAIGFLSTVGRLLFGMLSDLMGREKAVTLSFICSMLGILILLLLPSLKSVFWLYLYAIFFGVGFGARGPVLTAMAADIYHGKNLGNIYGFINIGNGIGGAFGPWLAGYLFDLTGSYSISFITCIPILILTCILYWIAGRSIRR